MATSQLIRSFANNGPRGETFFNASNFPHKDSLLHKQLLDGTCPSATELRGSIGNPPLQNGPPFDVYAKDMLKSDAEWEESISQKFQAWNDPGLSVKDRFRILHEEKVVAALGVFGPRGGPLAIAVVANPIVTVPDPHNVATHGAPRWDNVFAPALTNQFVENPAVPTHCVVASLDATSRGALEKTRAEFAEATLPVILTGGEFVGTKPNNGDVFSWLLLPDGCCPPVGLLWPTSTTFDEFQSSLANRNGGLYKGFLALLKKETAMIQAWFTAVNASDASFHISIASALPLWNVLLDKDHPTNDAVMDEEGLAPFRVQRERFLDSLIIDWVLYSKCRARENKRVERAQFATWLQRAGASYPTELGLTVEISRRPFLAYLFPPEPDWPMAEIRPLLQLDDDWDVPAPYEEYDTAFIPMTARDFVPVRTTKAAGTTSSLAEYSQVFGTVPSATTQAAPGGSPTTPAAGTTAAVTPSPLTGYGGVTLNQQNLPQQGQSLLQQFSQDPFASQATPVTANRTATTMGGVTPSVHPMVSPYGQPTPLATQSPAQLFGQPSGTAAVGASSPFTSTQGNGNPFSTPTNGGPFGGVTTQLNPWATIAAMGGIPGAAQLFSTVKTQRYALMQHANMTTEQTRGTCNPVLIQAALLLSKAVSQPLYFKTGQEVPSTQWMEISQPSYIGKIMLTPHDHGYKGGDEIAVQLQNAINYRASMSKDEFAGVQFPQELQRTALPASVQKAMYSVASWEVGKYRRAPTMASKKWHPFHLLPLLNPSYTTEFLPANGLDIQTARQFGKLLYYMLAMLGAKSDTGGYDDSDFADSFFGFVLRYICTVPQNQDLTEIWQRYPRNCTQQWMVDVCATLELAHSMVMFRAGADFRSLGIQDGCQAMNPHVHVMVVPTMMGMHSFSRSHVSYVDSMHRLLQQFQTKWGAGIDVYDSKWRTPSDSAFYATTGDHLHDTPFDGNTLPPLVDRTPKKPKRQRRDGVPQRTNIKPLFVCHATIPSKGNPFDDVLLPVMNQGDSPLIVNPTDGKSRNPICLRSAFVGHNTCCETGICQSPFASRNRSVGRERLHVDLNDPKWARDKYKEDLWKPVVEFVKKFQAKKLIGPSQWLKEVTPNTQWAPHTPPPSVKKRWPGTFDPQAFPQDQRVPEFMDIAVWVQASGFLDAENEEKLTVVHPDLVPGSLVLPFWLTKPWQPLRRRFWGFGKESSDRVCNHDKVNPMSTIHHTWRMLTPAARRESIKAFPQWKKYAALRRFACTHSLAILRQKRVLQPEEEVPTTLNSHRAWLNSAGLLRFDFLHGDFIRYLGGEYTNRERDFNAEWDVIEKQLRHRSAPSDFPPVKLDMCYELQTEGAPLQCNYVTPMSATVLRDEYDNHPSVDENLDTVMKKFAKEEWNTYHIHYLRFVYEFMPGLIINPIQWAWDKGKGRICIDCSNGPDPLGSVNTYIPKPGPDNEVECPEVFYQFAFKRFLRHIMRMRVSRPNEPILLHADDIEAAFRRVLYHPDMAIAFAYFFTDYLMVPVGQVFGSRSAPSYYCILADLRQALAACQNNDEELHPLVQQCEFSTDDSTPLTQVPKDSHYPELTLEELFLYYCASFVDDNGVVAFRDQMPEAIHASIMSAFEVFGPEGVDRRGACLQEKKWTKEVSESFMFLGFLIDTHDMTVTWPFEKRKRLYDELIGILDRPQPRFVTPKEMAHIVGVVRSASDVAPWGTFLSFNLQNSLTAAARHAFSTERKWWNYGKIYLSKVATATIHQLLETLLEPEGSSLWKCPIALYLDRDFSHRIYSDASYAGIGGWSSDFGFLWRLCRETLVDFEFDMKPIDLNSSEPTDPSGEGLHINPLEFIGVIINLWLTLKFVQKAGPRAGGYILALLADNTTALAWMSLASRTKNPTLQGLARIASALLVHAANLFTKVCPTHISGDQNFVADALSRPPTAANPSQNVLDSVISEWSQLDGCHICLLPSSLLSTIASVISSPSIAKMGLTKHYLHRLDDATIILLLGTYATHVQSGDNLKHLTNVGAQTITNYVVSAHSWLEFYLGRTINILDEKHKGTKPKYHPFLSQQVADCRAWSQPRQKKEPLTMDMFVALHRLLCTAPDPLRKFLDKEYAVYDWCRLGVFTGFRVTEYAQARVPKGQKFLLVPNNPNVPEAYRGTPLAFILEDLTFYDRNHRVVPRHSVHAAFLQGDVVELEIRWRYDKSAHNFTIRRFRATGDPIFCPVSAAVSIVQRHLLLNVPVSMPLGVWSSTGRTYRFLKDTDVKKVLQMSVDLAYPDPDHYMQRHKHLVLPHSNRVTAAVCLQRGGASNDEIAFKLRWHPTSVPTYLRDCFQAVGDTLQKTVTGVLKMTFAASSA